ncbi:hypothetical protein DQ237_19245 [Blastococcus sp. TF02-8]|uniref:hypothetical protein n=1 Tax=Blastococcus sp. TF02-8 TaxID=2250574 RepID=UPI000DEB772D|nr:hypothetical protein [Blastococcus sp. TF02-8]RBY91948.1 hypothetical protein DQ237_19245 [Blastococcus sp. TF02-8]
MPVLLNNFSGLFVVTLSITYLLAVVSAVVDRRALATHVHALGRSGGDVLVTGWSPAGHRLVRGLVH